MRLFAPFSRPFDDTAERLYRMVVEQGRQPVFYADLGVPDTPDGRYDMIIAHVILVLRRLNRDHHETRELAQALFDLMFADMDRNLREMGVGDLAVGNRVKGMAQAFYGRLAAYNAALSSDDAAALRAALRRNLFRKAAPTDAQIATFAAYLRQEAARLDGETLQALISGRFRFGVVPVGHSEDFDG